MSRSRGRSAGQGGTGRRLQTIGLFVTLLAVAVLVGSLAAGLAGGGNGSDAAEPADPAGAENRRERPAGDAPAQPVRVAVLNASGIPRLADRGRARLREDRRFDVKEIGNATGFPPDSSLVLDRVGNVAHARAVADALGISRVETRPDANLYLDVTVVLGKDWAARNLEGVPSAAP